MASKPLEAHLYNDRVELRRGSNHAYRARIEGGKSYPVPNVTTILGMKDKSRALMWWQAKVIKYVVDQRAKAMMASLPQVGVSFRMSENGRAKMIADVRGMVDAVGTAADEVRDAAGDVGTQIHAYIEDYMNAKLAKKSRAPGTTGLDREVKRAVGQFATWFTNNEVEVVAVERPLFSIEHFMTGQTDFILRVAGKLGVWDAKTGANVYPEVMMQRAAYREMWDEEFPNNTCDDAGGVLFFCREEVDPVTKTLTGDFEAIHMPDTHQRDFEAFLACKTLYRFDKDAYKDLKAARGLD